MKSCEECGSVFAPKYRHQRFCGLICAGASSQKQRREGGAVHHDYTRRLPDDVREKLQQLTRMKVVGAEQDASRRQRDHDANG